MIQLKIIHLNHSAKLTVPAEYERVVRAQSIGLDHDPEKYTLRWLGAEFTFTTEEESRMVQLIDRGNTLRQAMSLLSEMMYPLPDRTFNGRGGRMCRGEERND